MHIYSKIPSYVFESPSHSFMHSSRPICSSLCPLYMVKVILTAGDKHRLDAWKHKKGVSEGESCSTVPILPLQPCLVCTQRRWQDLMFHQLLSSSFTVTSSTAYIPVYPVVKNSMQCATGLFCIFWSVKQVAKRNKSDWWSIGSAFRCLFHAPLFVSSLFLSPSLKWHNLTPAWCYYNPHYTFVVLSQTYIEVPLSQNVLFPVFHPIYSFPESILCKEIRQFLWISKGQASVFGLITKRDTENVVELGCNDSLVSMTITTAPLFGRKIILDLKPD